MSNRNELERIVDKYADAWKEHLPSYWKVDKVSYIKRHNRSDLEIDLVYGEQFAGAILTEWNMDGWPEICLYPSYGIALKDMVDKVFC